MQAVVVLVVMEVVVLVATTNAGGRTLLGLDHVCERDERQPPHVGRVLEATRSWTRCRPHRRPKSRSAKELASSSAHAELPRAEIGDSAGWSALGGGCASRLVRLEPTMCVTISTESGSRWSSVMASDEASRAALRM